MKINFSKHQKYVLGGTFVVALAIHYFVVGGKEATRLVRQLEHGDADTRKQAAQELGALGSSRSGAVTALRTALKDEDPDVRATAIYALQRIDRDEAINGLVDALESRNPGVRLDATEALERMGSNRAKNVLQNVQSENRARYERTRMNGWASEIRREFKRKKDDDYKAHRQAYDTY